MHSNIVYQTLYDDDACSIPTCKARSSATVAIIWGADVLFCRTHWQQVSGDMKMALGKASDAEKPQLLSTLRTALEQEE